MTVIFVEISDLLSITTLLVGIPESAGLLLFGVVLVMTAVLIRRLLGRGDEAKSDQKLGKKI